LTCKPTNKIKVRREHAALYRIVQSVVYQTAVHYKMSTKTIFVFLNWYKMLQS